jgi:hypothetical protein
MGLLDVLNQYQHQNLQPPPTVHDDFDRVAQEANPEELGAGLEEAFRSDATPPFEHMVGQLYEKSDDHTRAGLLNEILGSLSRGAGGGLAGALGGGVLGGLLRDRLGGNGRISPDEAREVPARDVQEATAEAARRNPGLMQQLSQYYARHPQLVQMLGQTALSILMSGMARRRMR